MPLLRGHAASGHARAVRAHQAPRRPGAHHRSSRSGTKSSIGSAFFVSADGHAITNYHVVSDLVMHPEDYTAELVREDGQTRCR